jgi:acetylornithine deacetylase/succinyl-diaminopimelate desuccinylase-like protein
MAVSQTALKELFEFLSIPSISAQKVHNKDMINAVRWLQSKLTDLGFEASILPTGGHPVLYAELITKKTPTTLLIYGHYDVQDAGNLNEWTTKPFCPEIRSGNVYARGAADDKGQLYTWLAALSELKNERLPLNIKFIIEGEEEVGSENLDRFVEQNKSLLSADVAAISDTHCLSETLPMIDYGLRGLVYCEIKVKTLGKDVHSGIYGGNVLNPANVLAQIIAKLKDEDHKILIPGFYDDVRKLAKDERERLKEAGLCEKTVIEETGAEVVAGEVGFIPVERAGARPTLDVNGIWSGYTGEGPKTIIPSAANAKISMRLVPNQASKDIYLKFENYLQSIVPRGVELDIRLLSTGEPILMDTSSKFFKAAENAYQKVFGNKPVYELSGGSIPVTAVFKSVLGIDSIMMGYGLPDDGLHGPNEKLSLSMFEKGVKTNIEFLRSF